MTNAKTFEETFPTSTGSEFAIGQSVTIELAHAGKCSAVITGTAPSANRLGVVYLLDITVGRNTLDTRDVVVKSHAPGRVLTASA